MNKRIQEADKSTISKVLKDGAIKTISKKRRENRVYTDIDLFTGEYQVFNKYTLKKAENDNLGLEFRLYTSNNKRKERIRARIERMLATNQAYFLTLTFSDKMFARKCSTETRRRYISRFLKEQCKEYVANIDFGSTNKREHYHAVVVPKTLIDFAKYRELFDSNINCKRCFNNFKSKTQIAKYINKLTNHSLKDNGFYKRIIYSRD